MIKVSNLFKSYQDNKILENISLNLADHGLITLLGDSGCGKTTLLNLLSTLDGDFHGSIKFNNLELNKLSDKKRRAFRINNIGYVFQNFNLFENDTVYNNIYLVLSSVSNLSKELKNRKIEEALTLVDCLTFKDKYVRDLSGGEKQRVALARAIINNPKVIFADEPSGNLDTLNATKIFNLLREISKDCLVIVVTHNETLSNEYSDEIYRFENKKIIKELNNAKEANKPLTTMKEKRKAKSEVLSSKFIFRHFLNNVKLKKIRYLLTLIFLTIALISSGVSFYVNSELTSGITNMFTDALGKNSLILERKDKDPQIIDYYSANKTDLENIYKSYQGEVDYIGVNYLADFEGLFPNENSLYLEHENKLTNLFDITSRYFNEFIYEKHFKNTKDIYPQIFSKLNDDEIVISLNNQQMIDLCLRFRIPKTYQDLGAYLLSNKIKVVLKVENRIFVYEDEQAFRLKAVIRSPYKRIYHTNPYFNEDLFERRMQLPSSNNLTQVDELPWTLKKINYFHTIDFPTKVIEDLMYKIAYKSMIFENDSNLFSPLSISENSGRTNRVYVFNSFKKSIDLELLRVLKESSYNFNSYYFNTSSGYRQSGSILSGFSHPLFFSLYLEKINEVIDANSKVSLNEFYNIEIPELVCEGNLLKTSEDIVKLSSKLTQKIKGVYPRNIKEIAISEKMARTLGGQDIIGKELYMSSLMSSQKIDEVVKTKFKTVKVTICGIVNSEKMEVYHSPDYSISLFRDLFNYSSLELNIESIVFMLENKIDEQTVEKLNTMYPEYYFFNPTSDIEKGIKETMNYILIFLLDFSLISILSSIVLISIITYINFLDSKRDVALLIALGFSSFEIMKMFFLNNLFTSSFSLVNSSIGLVFASYLLKESFTNSFGLAFSFIFPLSSIFFMIIVVFIVSALSILLINRPINQLNTIAELH